MTGRRRSAQLALLSVVAVAAVAVSLLVVDPRPSGGRASTAAGNGNAVLPSDRGSLFAEVAADQLASLGIALDAPNSTDWPLMRPDAVKVSHGLATLVSPSGEDQWPWFPYRKFIGYEQQEVRAGRPPLRLTATYEGRSRPVYWNWSLGFPAPGQRPKVTDSSQWEQGVNLGDDRYVQWLVKNYLRPVLLHQYFSADGRPVDADGPYPNEWVGMDEVAVNYHLYGVLDDDGRWVPMDQGPVMDRAFPNGSIAFHTMFQRFFARLHQVNPQIRVMANVGSPDNWNLFQRDVADVDGLAVEDISSNLPDDGTGFGGASTPYRWAAIATFVGQSKVALLRSLLDRNSPTYDADLRTALMSYLILSGVNSAWAPQTVGDHKEIPPSEFEAMKNALGAAASGMAEHQEANSSGVLYTRTMVKGAVYVNETGHTVTVPCPHGGVCWDRAGNRVRDISVPDHVGDYLLTVAPS